MTTLHAERNAAVGRLTRYLERYGSPRVQLFLILMLTGIAGAAFSFALLRFGIGHMWLRYPLAAGLAYIIFLGALRLWADRQLERPDLVSKLDLGEKGTDGSRRKSSSDTNLFDLLDILSGLDDIPSVLVALVVLAVLLALAYLIVAAPVLLAEVLMDGLLVTGLWRRFTQQGATESLRGAVRATRVPAAVVIVGLGILGYLLEALDPSARSVGDLFRSVGA